MKKILASLCVLSLSLTLGLGVMPPQAEAQTELTPSEESLEAFIIQLLEQIIAFLTERIESYGVDGVDDVAEESTLLEEPDDVEELEEVDEVEEEEETYSGADSSSVVTSADEVRNSDGATVQTEFEISFDVEGFGSTHYVPLGAGLNSITLGVGFGIEDPNTNENVIGLGTGNINSAILTSTAPQQGDFFRLGAGERETFTVQVEVDSDGGAFTGAHRLQLKKLRFMKDTDGTGAVNLTLRPEEKYQTRAVVLDA